VLAISKNIHYSTSNVESLTPNRENPMTEKQKFQNHLKSIGFNITEVQSSLVLNPIYYKTFNGDHFISSGIHVNIFGGSDTPAGGLGCIVFSRHGSLRKYRCRNVDTSPELFKYVFTPKTAGEAIGMFMQWNELANITLSKYKKVL